jgi:hypothetical protein
VRYESAILTIRLDSSLIDKGSWRDYIAWQAVGKRNLIALTIFISTSISRLFKTEGASGKVGLRLLNS